MQRETQSQLDTLAVMLMVMVAATWGFNQIAVKVANGGISPVWQAGLRSLGSALIVWAWSWSRGVRIFERDGTLWLGVIAGVIFGVEFILLYAGLVFTTASRSALFFYTQPFFVALGAHIFLSDERLNTVKSIGLLLAFAGIALVFADALRFPTYRELLGDVMVLTAAILWGGATVFIKASKLGKISPNRTLLYQLAVSGVMLPPISLLIGEPGFFDPTPIVMASFAFQVVLVVPVSFLTWFWLISRYPASRVAAFIFLAPLFGVFFGVVLLDEPLTLTLIAAAALVATGLYLVNRPAPT